MNRNVFTLRGLLSGLGLSLACLPLCWQTPAYAEQSGYTIADFTSMPINVQENSVAPMLMVAASNDHQLYFKAYDDTSDLDDDGIPDTTYKNSVDYYGYFDSYKCYDYSTANKRFEPIAVTADKYCVNSGGVNNDGYWSGNFLNWVSMARIDAVRKILFGGARRVDTSSDTVLERTYLPHDAHSWAKHYVGTDLADLTPFTLNNTATSTTANSVSAGARSFTSLSISGSGTKTFTISESGAINNGDYVVAQAYGDSSKYMQGNVTVSGTTVTMTVSGSSGSGTYAEWKLYPRKQFWYSGGSWSNNDWVRVVRSADSSVFMQGQIVLSGGAMYLYVRDAGGVTSSSYNDWTVLNLQESGITLCNTTDDTGSSDVSELVTDPPLIKVMRGNYSLWAGNERWQCTWSSNSPISDNHSTSNGNNSTNSSIPAYTSSPSYNSGLGNKEYVARVQACVSGLIGQENCKQYPHGNYKPIGLVQRYGDNGQLLFGMMAGSYTKNRSGGVLIKDVANLEKEVDTAGDGTFINVADKVGGPQARNKSEGLINAWSLYRIVKYKHSDGTYGTSGMNNNNCTWGRTSFTDGQCMNWGNPFAEIYLNAVRYFAGEPISGTFRANDSSVIDGLNTPLNWDCPLAATNYCARLSIVNFNSSVISYDANSLDDTSDGVGAMGSTKTSSQLTDEVGAGEGIHGNAYFVGETATDTNQMCTAKTVDSLGAVLGICPEAPRLEGSYRVAGLSYWAHTNDIRSSGPSALDGIQKVDTYSVALSSAVPSVTIPVPGGGGQTVKILPACRDASLSPEGNCAIVDFKIVEQNLDAGTGKFYVNWEDSEQGGDFDQDMWGTLEYAIDPVTSKLDITTDVHAQSTPYKLAFGYVLSGTTQDGYHAHSGINSYTYSDSASIVNGGSCSGGCVDSNSASTARYTLGTSSAGLLNDPLWYASKWGNFDDQNGDGTPDQQVEWDQQDTDLQPTPDGVPDSYFYASNPSKLEDSLNKVFLTILKRASSGTAAAVVSTTATGEGAIYQAYFEPTRQDLDGREAKWIGTLQSFWLDSYGHIREDDGDAVLEGYNTDPVIEFFYDDVENKTRAKRWVSTSDSNYDPTSSTTVDLEDLHPIWNARKQLYYTLATDLSAQRTYSDSAATGRYIFTWADGNGDGAVSSGEQTAFVDSSFASSNYGVLDVPTLAEAQDLVTYIRGNEMSATDYNSDGDTADYGETYRARVVDYDDNGTAENMRLGDIVNSTPTVVAAPKEAFDLLYNDTSYAVFRSQYANRRNVVYVGANDGMIHAFNAGFYDVASNTFDTAGKKVDGSDATEHPLGTELWAYVPRNLLSHLRWLKDPDYTHVYYIDGKPRVFDAKVFTADTDHPGGWGTVMVVGMRLGGGAMTVDASADGLGNPHASDDVTLKSAYVVFDITNPEAEPKVLAEITLPDGSFTTLYPTAMAFRDLEGTDPNKWYLILGSGPGTLATATSSAKPDLYIYDISDATNISLARSFTDIGVTGTFIGDPVAADWDLNYKADTVYFGLLGDTASDAGGLMRLNVAENSSSAGWSSPTTLVDTSQPVVVTPTVGIDEYLNHWVFFGTGRLFVSDDRASTTQQTLYGVKDDGSGSTLGKSDLIDVSAVEVLTNGNLNNGPTGVSTFDALETKIDEDSSVFGWYIDLQPATTSPAARNIVGSALAGSVLFSSIYTPSTDLCTGEGTSELYGLYYKTGTAFPEPNVFGSETSGTDTVSIRSVDIGRGVASTPAIHSGAGTGQDQVTVFTQTSTGMIFRQEATTISNVRSGEISWREYPYAE